MTSLLSVNANKNFLPPTKTFLDAEHSWQDRTAGKTDLLLEKQLQKVRVRMPEHIYTHARNEKLLAFAFKRRH